MNGQLGSAQETEDKRTRSGGLVGWAKWRAGIRVGAVGGRNEGKRVCGEEVEGNLDPGSSKSSPPCLPCSLSLISQHIQLLAPSIFYNPVNSHMLSYSLIPLHPHPHPPGIPDHTNPDEGRRSAQQRAEKMRVLIYSDGGGGGWWWGNNYTSYISILLTRV